MVATPAWPPRSLPRLFVEAALSEGAAVSVEGSGANYLANVLRLKAGDALLLFNGRDGEWLARIVEPGRKRVTLTIAQATREQETVPDLWLAFAPIKKGRVDWLVEKAVELGVARLLPVITERTIVRDLNLERMRSHIVEAAEQCGRTALATIEAPARFGDWLAARPAGRTLYFADETGGPPFGEAIRPGPATILVGPEGGFTPDEAARVRAAPGAVPVSLGPRILRAETAALAAVTAWMATAGDW
ncbi:16S rRNA (uracil(1498)-N(3))-methyltransferase [Sphingomonas sp. ASV193]|uniref:16S rRNA (uracil(1498)-N(3))-methyltransferase n=1 Tax=Sphingomonas sp. ASV193 TaxID=3144405 RepID=UPI0032E88C3A